MESRTVFTDITLYDVSAWAQPLAFNQPYARLKRLPSTRADSGEQPATAGEQRFSEGTLQVHAASQDSESLGSIGDALRRAPPGGLEIHAATGRPTPRREDLSNLDFAFLEPVNPMCNRWSAARSWPSSSIRHTRSALAARADLPPFRRGTALLEASDNAYATPVRYEQEPLLSGLIGPEQLDEPRAQPAVIAKRQGNGLVVRFANNPLFRGFWRGSERLFENSLYFGQLVRTTRLPE
jgi:hypothetical protein